MGAPAASTRPSGRHVTGARGLLGIALLLSSCAHGGPGTEGPATDAIRADVRFGGPVGNARQASAALVGQTLWVAWRQEDGPRSEIHYWPWTPGNAPEAAGWRVDAGEGGDGERPEIGCTRTTCLVVWRRRTAFHVGMLEAAAIDVESPCTIRARAALGSVGIDDGWEIVGNGGTFLVVRRSGRGVLLSVAGSEILARDIELPPLGVLSEARVVAAVADGDGFCAIVEHSGEVGCDPVTDPERDCRNASSSLRSTARLSLGETGEVVVGDRCAAAPAGRPEIPRNLRDRCAEGDCAVAESSQATATVVPDGQKLAATILWRTSPRPVGRLGPDCPRPASSPSPGPVEAESDPTSAADASQADDGPAPPGVHEAGGTTFGPVCEYEPACQARRLLAHLTLTAEELDPDLAPAQHAGSANPGCWAREDAPPGPARRLRGVIASGAGARTRVCYFEYERRGTHDDVIVKVFVFVSPSEAESVLDGPYLREKRARLLEAGLDPPTRRDNVVFYVTASEPNLDAARRIHRLVARRLSGPAARNR